MTEPVHTPSAPRAIPDPTLAARLRDVFVAPGDVFEHVANSSPTLGHWLVPGLLVWIVGTISFLALVERTDFQEKLTANPMVLEILGPPDRATMNSPANHDAALAVIRLEGLIGVGASTLFGTAWSALILWTAGRTVLRRPFPYVKALEVAGLAQMILALGVVTTTLLIFATDDPTARPALSLLLDATNPRGKIHLVLEFVNLFYVWAAVVLAAGLAKLAKVSFAEAAFWVFGYWFVLRIGLLLLSAG